MTRTYRKSKRHLSEAATRQRIVDATIALHEEMGPLRTTISAVAARAGVQRLTVYRHFPDETQLFQACTSCWLERHPPPGPPRSGGECAALVSLYRYYRETAAMWRAAYRDEAQVPALAAPMRGVRDYLAGFAGALAEGFANRPRAAVTAAHIVAFATWDDLVGHGLADEEIADLALEWLAVPLRDEAPRLASGNHKGQ